MKHDELIVAKRLFRSSVYSVNIVTFDSLVHFTERYTFAIHNSLDVVDRSAAQSTRSRPYFTSTANSTLCMQI